LIQFRQILDSTGLDYVDMLLIHWPTQVIPQSSDAACRNGSMYNEKTCRRNTWRAMLDNFDRGQAKAVGVSNFNITHLQEIIDAGLRLPSYNQCPFHLYRSTTQQALRDFCTAHNITFGGYSPLGVPDWFIFPEKGTGMSWTPMEDPLVQRIAQAHNRTAAQVFLQWHWAIGIPTNPRSQNAAHMRDNLNSYDFTLSDAEVKQLSSAPQDLCALDPNYECANNTSTALIKPLLVKQVKRRTHRS